MCIVITMMITVSMYTVYVVLCRCCIIRFGRDRTKFLIVRELFPDYNPVKAIHFQTWTMSSGVSAGCRSNSSYRFSLVAAVTLRPTTSVRTYFSNNVSWTMNKTTMNSSRRYSTDKVSNATSSGSPKEEKMPVFRIFNWFYSRTEVS